MYGTITAISFYGTLNLLLRETLLFIDFEVLQSLLRGGEV